MLAVSTFQARRLAFAKHMQNNSVAIFAAHKELTRSRDTEYLFRQDSDFHYLTNFPEPDAYCVITKSSAGDVVSHLFCREKDELAEIWHGRRIGAEKAKDDYLFDQTSTIENLDAKLIDLIKDRVACYWPLGELSYADELIQACINKVRSQHKLMTAPKQLLDSREVLHEMRLIKSAEEIEVMSKAGVISANAHKRAMQFSQAGKFEYQLEAEILHEFAMNGARFAAYNSIVASGDNANILHYTENSDELVDGDLILIDAGCELAGYAADITRTFPVNGQFSSQQRAIYQLVLDAQLASFELIKPGNTLKQATDKAIEVISQGLVDLGILSGSLDEVIEQRAYRDYFMHGLSHWLGLDVHDVGAYKVANEQGEMQERPLLPGMVITVEPGIYIPKGCQAPEQYHGIGVRIEDNLVITETGYQNLTEAAPKTIDDIEALMRNAD
ncbi:Xaa-Pro aminopeptidase [Catenovulum sp. SM1970]|uniref:Xaa-Pro aminopeptidase n=1 Tax=Marinifaba aquimaris TaxID=2741323 RepID=UPI001571CD48|nr:Xaa-Pro aminopeptidase [Marinifaba aquimaris]NTS77178.1 Xaa-Pro aminopeptidase [Marinifaba aquimaris]